MSCTLPWVQSSWMLPSKVFLPALSLQPCARYLVSMQAVFDAVMGLILQVWRCRTEREGFCRAKISWFSFGWKSISDRKALRY